MLNDRCFRFICCCALLLFIEKVRLKKSTIFLRTLRWLFSNFLSFYPFFLFSAARKVIVYLLHNWQIQLNLNRRKIPSSPRLSLLLSFHINAWLIVNKRNRSTKKQRSLEQGDPMAFSLTLSHRKHNDDDDLEANVDWVVLVAMMKLIVLY